MCVPLMRQLVFGCLHLSCIWLWINPSITGIDTSIKIMSIASLPCSIKPMASAPLLAINTSWPCRVKISFYDHLIGWIVFYNQYWVSTSWFFLNLVRHLSFVLSEDMTRGETIIALNLEPCPSSLLTKIRPRINSTRQQSNPLILNLCLKPLVIDVLINEQNGLNNDEAAGRWFQCQNLLLLYWTSFADTWSIHVRVHAPVSDGIANQIKGICAKRLTRSI